MMCHTKAELMEVRLDARIQRGAFLIQRGLISCPAARAWHDVVGLHWGYIGVVLGLHWGYTGVVLALYWGCTGAVLGFYWGCTGVVLGLYRCCTGVALGGK